MTTLRSALPLASGACSTQMAEYSAAAYGRYYYPVCWAFDHPEQTWSLAKTAYKDATVLASGKLFIGCMSYALPDDYFQVQRNPPRQGSAATFGGYSNSPSLGP